jgi:hypothetical protein
MERGYLEDLRVDEKRIFKEYGGRRKAGSFASKQGPVAVFWGRKCICSVACALVGFIIYK